MKSNTILVLGGNSIKDKEWIETLRDELSELSEHFILHCYKHWYCDEEIIDFYFELEEMKRYDDYEHLIIIAKSVGSILAIKAIQNDILKPEKCIFMGFPLIWAYRNYLDIDTWSARYTTPTLFIQNSNDSFCSYDKLLEYIECQNIENAQVCNIKNTSSEYDDFEYMRKRIKLFLDE